MNINESIHLAFQHYQTGDFQQAKDTCMEILKKHPDNEAMLYLLGVIYAQHEEYDLAIQNLTRALQCNAKNADAYLALGAIFQKRGLVDEAVEYYQKAVGIDPDIAEAYENLGDIFRDKRQFDEAITHYKKAIQYIPDSAEIHCSLGNIFKEKGQLDLAMYYYRKALKYNPDYAEIYNNLGLILTYQHQLDEAITHYQKAVQLNPDYAEALTNLGVAFHQKGKFDEAIKYLQMALQSKGNIFKAHYYLGDALFKKGRYHEASVSYQKAIELESENPRAHFNWAFCLFSLGDLNRGWKEFQWHWKFGNNSDYLKNCPKPLWTGFDISERVILVRDVPKPSSGFGDTIQFIRYAPLVARRCAKVIFQTHKELVSLLQAVEGISQIVEFGQEPSDFDVHCFLLDLPFVFDVSLDNIPLKIPYIPVNPQLIEEWEKKIQHHKDKFKVGLVWAAGGGDRSCDFETFSLLGKNSSNAIFFSLQKGRVAEQAKNFPEGMQFIDLTEEIHDFTDTAALIQNLDLVISVDTSVAHLAGALGKPVWTLLPFVSPWRWMLDREDSPWYPSMRLFRQPSDGDWESVIVSVRGELLQLLGRK
ncbi:MAG: tetratricopeptide repeat protein [Nitrospirota bacterium]